MNDGDEDGSRVPSSYPNFGRRVYGIDRFGIPSVTWDDEEKVTHSSTNLPPWLEDRDDEGEVFQVAFTVYGHEDKSALQESSLNSLANHTSCLALRMWDLTH
ncbi:hypothetical protein KSP39_PZI014284 [Platanthera zijinensis]|uniref:Uncharacterized protein n=1 Tax=Platanthera zijinensis TaxID=2320716 RepID=A0AAP0B9Y4_9ASPA